MMDADTVYENIRALSDQFATERGERHSDGSSSPQTSRGCERQGFC